MGHDGGSKLSEGPFDLIERREELLRRLVLGGHLDPLDGRFGDRAVDRQREIRDVRGAGDADRAH
jgi:hypothetical protein